jgi:hypothetical protein
MYYHMHPGYGAPGTQTMTIESGNTMTAVGGNGPPAAEYAPEAPAPPVVPIAVQAGGATGGDVVDEHGGGADGNFSAGFPTWIEGDMTVEEVYQQGRSWLTQRTSLPFIGPMPNWSIGLAALVGGYMLLK